MFKTKLLGIVLVTGLVSVGLVLSQVANASEYVADANTLVLLHFNEGSGGTSADSSGNNFNGTVTGAQWIAGKYGSALSFDGNDYVNLGNNPILGGGMAELTIEAWVKRPVGAGGSQTIVSSWVEGYHFVFSGDYLDFYIQVPDGSIRVYSLTGNDGQWHHVAGTYDGSWVRLYVDGVKQGMEVAASGNIQTQGGYYVAIGAAYNWGPGLYYTGSIDELRISNIARTEDEIKMSADVPIAPTADAGPDKFGVKGQVVTLDGSGSSDPDGTIVSYAWSGTGIVGPANQVTVNVLVEAGMSEEITLTVTDDNGLPSSDSATVTDLSSVIGPLEDRIDAIVDWIEDLENALPKGLTKQDTGR